MEAAAVLTPQLGASGPSTPARPGSIWLWPQRKPWGPVGLFALTVGAYVAGSQVAWEILDFSGLSAVFFIPAGVTVGFLLRVSRGQWWIVLAAAGIAEASVDLSQGYPAAQTAWFVAANVLEPLIGALVIARFCREIDLARVRHLTAFVIGPVLVGPAMGAVVGAAAVLIYRGTPFVTTFGQWWLGDALGVVIVGAAILAWGSSPDHRSLSSPQGIAFVAGAGLLTVAGLLTQGITWLFLFLVTTVVAGSMFGPRAVAITVSMGSAGVAVFVGLSLVDPAFDASLTGAGGLVVQKLRLGLFALAGYLVAAEATERELAIAGAVAAESRARIAEVERRAEHRIALRLQRALLPDPFPKYRGVTVAARYQAGSDRMAVGGDWYDVFELSGHRLVITVGDVVGHGLEAAAAMGRLRTAIAAMARVTESPGAMLTQLDEFASGQNGPEFATAMFAVLDPESGVLTFASAGHPPVLVITGEGASEWLLKGRSAPVAGIRIPERPQASTRLGPGSLIIMYTDGLIERRGEELQTGLDRLESEALRLRELEPVQLCEALMQSLRNDRDLDDDAVLLVLRYEPEATAIDERPRDAGLETSVSPVSSV